ncbi:MAG: magnesium/cobalt transporter CorA [bacterium]
MLGFGFKRSKKAGLPPGSLVHIGERKQDKARVSFIRYSREVFEEHRDISMDEVGSLREPGTVTWLNVDGLHEVDILRRIGDAFDVHNLVLEDILDTSQRPKLEVYEDHLYIVLRMLDYDESTGEVTNEQLSFLLGEDYLISFQESEGDVFDAVRERLRAKRGRIRGSGPDYLAYALIDSVVDQYFHILEELGSRIELLEDELMNDPGSETLHQLHNFKRELIKVRSSVWPLRKLISLLEKKESPFIEEETALFFRDISDHVVQIMDTVEPLREMLTGMLDIYLSTMSNRMNDVMKTLTIIATIFIPLTFVAGIYGMNFEYMPELSWDGGYFLVLGLMFVLAAIMLVFFKRKRWL